MPWNQVGAEGNGAEKKNKGQELRKWERKLQGIWEQQETWDTVVARLKKAEVVRKRWKTGAVACKAGSEAQNGKREVVRIPGGPEMADGVLPEINQAGKTVCPQQSQTGLTPTGVALEVLQKCEVKRRTGEAEQERIGDPQKTREWSGRPRKVQERVRRWWKPVGRGWKPRKRLWMPRKPGK